METITPDVRIAREPSAARRMWWLAGTAVGGPALAACFAASLLITSQQGETWSYGWWFGIFAFLCTALPAVLQAVAWLPVLRMRDLSITFTAGGLTYRTRETRRTVRWPDVRWIRLGHRPVLGTSLHVRLNAPRGSARCNGLFVPLGADAPPPHELRRTLMQLSGNTARLKS
ncbi:hypothetical protein GCM10027174_44050 [Salinifilum aidingensis]